MKARRRCYSKCHTRQRQILLLFKEMFFSSLTSRNRRACSLFDGKKAPGLTVLICSGRGSCLSAEISLFNVLHSRAVALALVVDMPLAANLLTATSRYILLPKRSSTSTPPPEMTVYPDYD